MWTTWSWDCRKPSRRVVSSPTRRARTQQRACCATTHDLRMYIGALAQPLWHDLFTHSASVSGPVQGVSPRAPTPCCMHPGLPPAPLHTLPCRRANQQAVQDVLPAGQPTAPAVSEMRVCEKKRVCERLSACRPASLHPSPQACAACCVPRARAPTQPSRSGRPQRGAAKRASADAIGARKRIRKAAAKLVRDRCAVALVHKQLQGPEHKCQAQHGRFTVPCCPRRTRMTGLI